MLMVHRVHQKVSLSLLPDFEAIIDRYGSLEAASVSLLSLPGMLCVISRACALLLLVPDAHSAP